MEDGGLSNSTSKIRERCSFVVSTNSSGQKVKCKLTSGNVPFQQQIFKNIFKIFLIIYTKDYQITQNQGAPKGQNKCMSLHPLPAAERKEILGLKKCALKLAKMGCSLLFNGACLRKVHT